jgi:murein DD-endopeptidase MepM/ murein hydrolase activator NlpD
MPADLQAMVDSVHRTPANNTKKLVAALAPLEQYGLDPTQQAVVGFGRFPVAGPANWSDDWWFPRFGPGWRLHQGLDIFAAYGTPVRAPVDGTVRIHDGGLGGLSVYVTQPDRTYWYMAHLSGVAAGLAEGAVVKTGQVVGYVGTSGNARGGAAHLHFEVHPRGGPAIPPKPVVDKFVNDALGLVPQLLDIYARSRGQAPAAAAAAAVVAPEPAIDTLSPRQAVLWATAANPTGGTIRLVEQDARLAASKIDWVAVQQRVAEEQEADRAAWFLLRPLIPEALARLMEYG